MYMPLTNLREIYMEIDDRIERAKDLIRKRELRKGETVVFLHTGGAVGLFGYTGFFDQATT